MTDSIFKKMGSVISSNIDAVKAELQTHINQKVNSNLLGVANGVATLDVNGTITFTQLPPMEKYYPHSNNTIYVSTTGNDSTADGSSTAPFLTIDAAVTHCQKFTWHDVPTIQLADGTYNVGSGVELPNIKYADGKRRFAIIQGNTSNQDAVVINATARPVLVSQQAGVDWTIKYVKCISTSGVIMCSAGTIRLMNMTVQTTAGNTWWTGFLILAMDRGIIFISGNVKIAGTSCYAVMVAYRGGCIQSHNAEASTMTIESPLTCTVFVLSQVRATVEIPGISYTGQTVTGTKYLARFNSFVGLWGKTLPGSVAGSTADMSSFGA